VGRATTLGWEFGRAYDGAGRTLLDALAVLLSDDDQ
jgi:hypothetical protein